MLYLVELAKLRLYPNKQTTVIPFCHARLNRNSMLTRPHITQVLSHMSKI